MTWLPGRGVDPRIRPGREDTAVIVAASCRARAQPGTASRPPSSVVCSSGDELLPTVDVVRRAGERRVDHDVDGERGDVGRPDHAPDGQRGAQLVAAGIEIIAQQLRGQGGVHETGGDQVDPDWPEL